MEFHGNLTNSLKNFDMKIKNLPLEKKGQLRGCILKAIEEVIAIEFRVISCDI